MRTALLCLCVLGLTVGANGQGEVTSPIQVRPASAFLTASLIQPIGRSRTLPTGEIEHYVIWLAKGAEIRLGSTVLTADEAEITNGVPGEPSDVQLRGNVRLNGTLEIARAVIHGESK